MKGKHHKKKRTARENFTPKLKMITNHAAEQEAVLHHLGLVIFINQAGSSRSISMSLSTKTPSVEAFIFPAKRRDRARLRQAVQSNPRQRVKLQPRLACDDVSSLPEKAGAPPKHPTRIKLFAMFDVYLGHLVSSPTYLQHGVCLANGARFWCAMSNFAPIVDRKKRNAPQPRSLYVGEYVTTDWCSLHLPA